MASQLSAHPPPLAVCWSFGCLVKTDEQAHWSHFPQLINMKYGSLHHHSLDRTTRSTPWREEWLKYWWDWLRDEEKWSGRPVRISMLLRNKVPPPPLVFLIMCVCAHMCVSHGRIQVFKRGLFSVPFTIGSPTTELCVAHRQLLISGFGKKGKMKELMSETRPHCLQQLCGLYETRHLAGSLCMYNNLIIPISCPGSTAWYWKDKVWCFLFICSY